MNASYWLVCALFLAVFTAKAQAYTKPSSLILSPSLVSSVFKGFNPLKDHKANSTVVRALNTKVNSENSMMSVLTRAEFVIVSPRTSTSTLVKPTAIEM